MTIVRKRTVTGTGLSSDATSFGAADAFCEYYAAHAHGVYITALAILKDPDAARDVAHDVFLRAWQRPGRYDPALGNRGAWLRAVARNISIDRLRSARRRAVYLNTCQQDAPPVEEVFTQFLEREQSESVRRAIRRLALPHQRLIEMAFYKGLTHSDIAQQLHHPLGTVKSRLRRALAALRTSIATCSTR